MAIDIAFWWIFPILALSIAISIWFYSKDKWFSQQTKWMQRILRGLRAFSFFLIGFLLLGLILQSNNFREEKPVLITLLDNSSSLLNYKDSSNVKKSIAAYQAALKERFADKFEFVDLLSGQETRYADKFTLKDAKSNLAQGFKTIQEDFYNRNIGGIVFLSDGNFNEDANPSYEAEKINFTPVFSLMVGDTVTKRDQMVKNVSVNEVVFYKNKFPVEVDLQASKLGRRAVAVSILKDGKTVASQTVNFKGENREFQQVNFELEANAIGVQGYQVVIEPIDNEYNYENNKRTFYIEVIDSRSKVLVLAGAPHPDISAIKQELEKDENLEVKTYIGKDWDKDVKNVDLVVLHEPGYNSSAAQTQFVIDKKIPVLMVLGPNTSAGLVKDLGLGFSVPGGSQTDENQAVLNGSFSFFELSDELKTVIQKFPPLKSKFGSFTPKDASILAYQRIGNVQKKEPLIFFTKKNDVKYGFIYGEGLWQWRMSNFVQKRDHAVFNELMSKIAQYLLVKQNNSNFRVTLPKRFTKNEDVIINASFYNESMEAVNSAKIELTLIDEKSKQFKYQFGAQGTSYIVNAGTLKSGKYSWTAIAKNAGKSYKKSGVFIVEDIDIEKLDNTANFAVLNQLSKVTKGKLFPLKDFESLFKELETRKDITTVTYTDSIFRSLIDYKFLFFLLILILGLEWWLRRYLGSY
ncbi:MAG: hypothetical protein V4638_05995 [Bacteroidota bacterium]